MIRTLDNAHVHHHDLRQKITKKHGPDSSRGSWFCIDWWCSHVHANTKEKAPTLVSSGLSNSLLHCRDPLRLVGLYHNNTTLDSVLVSHYEPAWRFTQFTNAIPCHSRLSNFNMLHCLGPLLLVRSTKSLVRVHQGELLVKELTCQTAIACPAPAQAVP